MLYQVKDAEALGWVEEWERRCGWARALSDVPGSAPGLGAAAAPRLQCYGQFSPTRSLQASEAEDRGAEAEGKESA